MSKVDIKTLDSVTNNDTAATALINDNFKELQKAVENTLSRDGTAPNFMDADLDMNSYRIINSADPVEDNDIVNLKYVNERIGGAAEAVTEAKASASQAASSAQSALVSATNALNSANNAYTWSQEAKTAAEDPNVVAVGTDLRKGDASTIKITSGSIDNVNTVGNNIASVNTTAEIKDSINTVAADKANVDTVAGSIANVNKTGASIANVNAVAPHVDAIETVAPDIMDVVTVSGIADKVSNVSDNMSHVVAVDQNKTNIDKAVANEANITTAANNITNINTVAADITNVDQVVANKDNIDNVSANISDVKNVSANMQDVKDAVVSAGLAKSWAIDNINNRPEGSAKYWASQAQAAVQIGDATEEQKGWARLATAAEALAGTDDTTIMTPFKAALVATANVGRVLQLGFNGTLTGNVLTFVPDESTYVFKQGYDYEIDLLFPAAGTLPDSTQMVIKNGADTVQIVNVRHANASTPMTYGDMKQICRYDAGIGWRWVFNARFAVTDTGVKVLVMPSYAFQDDRYVTTDTRQTITGYKVFNNGFGNYRTNIDIVTDDGVAENASSKWAGSILFKKGNENVGSFEALKDANNSSIAHMVAHKSINGQPVYGVVRTVVTSNGTAYATAPNTPANAPANAITTVDYVKKKAGGLELGSVIVMPFGVDESENKYRYLNGQVLIQDQFSAFVTKVKSWKATRASLFTTEANWQAEKTNSKLGQCGKFVIDDTAGTIRLPLVKNINGLTDLSACGVIKAESLPNITGGDSSSQNSLVSPVRSSVGNYGAVHIIGNADESNRTQIGGEAGVLKRAVLDFSSSSSTYQDNAPVQQEAIQYPYAIVVNTGVEEAERPINNYQVNNVYSYGMSQYYKGTMNNNSWLKSAGQWNDGTVYTGMYQWLVEQVNAGVSGFVASTATYTDYDFVINTTDQTFRLPLLNGEEDLPDDRYDTLTLGESNTLYTAPANGFYRFSVELPMSSYFAIFESNSGDVANLIANEVAAIGQNYVAVAPVKRGQTIRIQYNNTPDVNSARFYYNGGNGNLYYYIGDTLQNAQLINVARIEEKLVTAGNPVGTIIAWSTATAPAGYLICDGSAVSRATYAALFAVIGTTYGAGDGNSTFNLPNLANEDTISYSHAADDSFQINFASGKTLVLGSQGNAAQYTTVTFPQEFTSTRYTALGNYQGNTYPDNGAARTSYLNTVQRTGTSMQIGSYNAGAGYVTYLVAGNLARGAYAQSRIIKCIKY